MTVKELAERIDNEKLMYGLTFENLPEPQFIQLINSMVKEQALRLKIPTFYYKSQATDSNFSMPDNAISVGLLYIESELDNKEIPIRTIHQANQEFPGWEENKIEGYTTDYYTRLVIYDPRNKDQPLYPIGFETGELIRMTYVGKFDDITAMSDSIWGGYIPEYHHIFVYSYLSARLFGKTEWYQVFQNKVNQLEEELYNIIQDVDWNDTYYASSSS